MSDRCLNRKQLAAKLGKTVEWTYRHLAKLQGFPPAVLPNSWSEAAVDRWLATRSTLAAPIDPVAPANDQPNPADLKAELKRRALAIAANQS